MEDNNVLTPEEQAQGYIDEPNQAINGNTSKITWGVVVLVAGCIWCLFELIYSILYFF